MILTEIISGRMEKYNFSTGAWETFLTLDNSNVVSADSQRQCTNDDSFNIGGVFSATLNLTVKIPPPYTTFNIKGCKVYLHSSLAGDIGVFFVTNVAGRVGRIFTLGCHDAIIWTDTSSFTDSQNRVVQRVIDYFDDDYSKNAQDWMNEDDLTGVVNRLCQIAAGVSPMVWWQNYDANHNLLDVCNADIGFGIYTPEGEGETDCPRDFFRYLAEISFGFVYTNPANGNLTLGQFAESKWGVAEIQASEIEYGSEEYADYNSYMRTVKTIAKGDDGNENCAVWSISSPDYSTADLFDIVIENNPFINGSYRKEEAKGLDGWSFLNTVTRNFYYAFHRPAEIVQQGYGFLVSPFRCTVHGVHEFHLGQKVLIHHRVHDTTGIYTHDSIITKICWSLNGGQTIMCCGGDSRALSQLYRGLAGGNVSKADKVRMDVQNHCYAIERKLSKLSGGTTGYLNYVGDISLSTSSLDVVTDAYIDENGALQLTKKTIEYVSGWSWYRNAAYFQNGLLMSDAESWGTGSSSDHTGTSTETYGTGGTHVYPPPPEPEPGGLSGVPPLAFYTTGSALQNYVIRGASGGVGNYYSITGKYRIPVRIIKKNLCVYTAGRTSGYLNTNGTVQPQNPANYFTSDFISIPSGISQMTYSFYASKYNANRIIVVCAYDENQNFIAAPVYEIATLTGDTRYSYPFDIPSGTAFIRYCYVTSAQNVAMRSSDYNMQLEIGGEATDYVKESNTFNIDLNAPLDSGESYTFDGSVIIGTAADFWNFLCVDTNVQPESVTIYYDAEE